MEQHPKVSVIVVAYRRPDLLKKCLASLRRQTFKDFEVIVVDNAEENRGFAGGVNEGIMRSRGDMITLLNDDAEACWTWLSKLVAAALSHPRCMIASLVLRPDTSLESAGCYIYPDGNGMCIRDGRKPDFPSGCAAMYRREMFKEIGLFDESLFPAYNEDTELGIRARRAGWGCIYEPQAVVYHHGSGSTSRNSIRKLFWVERNRLRIMRKHFTAGEIVKSIPWTIRRYLKGGEMNQLDRYNRFRIRRWLWDARDMAVMEHLGQGPILDVGCGDMITTRKIPGAIGMDLDRGDVEGSVYNIPYPSNYFGTVLLLEVIEHLAHPGEALWEIRRVLKWGGRLIVLFPNDRNFKLAWALTGMWGQIRQDWGHLKQWTPEDAARLMTKIGYSVVEERSIPINCWALALHHIIVGVKC